MVRQLVLLSMKEELAISLVPIHSGKVVGIAVNEGGTGYIIGLYTQW